MGLGLTTISKMIIQQLGGSIGASSKFGGEGSKFSFMLPVEIDESRIELLHPLAEEVVPHIEEED